MNTKLIILSFILCFLSCNSKQSETTNADSIQSVSKKQKLNKELYIQTISAVGSGDKEKVTKNISTIDSDYFEVTLSSFGNVGVGNGETGFRAGKIIEEPKINAEFKYVFFDVSDQNGTILEFKTSTEFLNFMSERGYEMVDQNKSKYHIDYTFKRKN